MRRAGERGTGSVGPIFAPPPPSSSLSVPGTATLPLHPSPLLPLPHPLAWGQPWAGFMGLAPVERIRG